MGGKVAEDAGGRRGKRRGRKERRREKRKVFKARSLAGSTCEVLILLQNVVAAEGNVAATQEMRAGGALGKVAAFGAH